jgi:hypothetical protein
MTFDDVCNGIFKDLDHWEDAGPSSGSGKRGVRVTYSANGKSSTSSSGPDIDIVYDWSTASARHQLMSFSSQESRELLAFVDQTIITSHNTLVGRGRDIRSRLLFGLADGAPRRYAIAAALRSYDKIELPVSVQLGAWRSSVLINPLNAGATGFANLVGRPSSCGYDGAEDPSFFEDEIFRYLLPRYDRCEVREVQGTVPESWLIRPQGVAGDSCFIAWAQPEFFQVWCEVLSHQLGSAAKCDAFSAGRSASISTLRPRRKMR